MRCSRFKIHIEAILLNLQSSFIRAYPLIVKLTSTIQYNEHTTDSNSSADKFSSSKRQYAKSESHLEGTTHSKLATWKTIYNEILYKTSYSTGVLHTSERGSRKFQVRSKQSYCCAHSERWR
jgi:hypothetical protein